MKRTELFVLVLIVVVALIGLYVLVGKPGSSGNVIYTYGRSIDDYKPNIDGCCFDVVTHDSSYTECYLSWSFAVKTREQALIDAGKTIGDITYVGPLRTGPLCLN